MEALVSIIIPVYNRESLLVETLESIQCQTYKNWECVIVDDHSTDNSIKLIERFIEEDSRFVLFKRPNNKIKGANSCRNYGFEKCRGSYVNWFDSDDIMHPDFIKKKAEAFKDNMDAVISKTKMFSNTINNIVGQENRTTLTSNILEDFLTLKITWYLPDIMWKKSFLENKVLFDEDLLAGQDRDFYARVLLDNPSMVVIDNYLTYYRWHDASTTKEVGNKKNFLLRKSILASTSKYIHILITKKRITNTLRLFYFKTIIKYLPFLYHDKESVNALIKVLKTLSFFNMNIVINWGKFSLAYLSLKLTGKGEKLLK
ncbi:glycosyltransferase family 2 protein [Flavivirga eckloniae]|uniref:Glycosyltransferase 2-like domain-containing protein n=1 Tax=Flavivirga eckloniae TaxID=1803846 RepID=A0A2K9PNL2_9FLAO|nr:glycosyltransferase [Flavivirga eckloniae]AUP78177.1 hypothetical protein C1H87_05385 [Flavivirga eckloniae]